MNNVIISALMLEACDEVTSKISSVLERFDYQTLARVANAGVRIRPLSNGERFADASPELRRLKISVDKWPVPPAGLFVVSERCVYLRQLTKMTIAHEFGHAIDLSFGNGEYLSNNDPEIIDAFQLARRFVTPYAASRIDEYFAEAIRAFVGCNDPGSPWPPVSRKKLAEYDPRLFNIVSRILSTPGANGINSLADGGG